MFYNYLLSLSFKHSRKVLLFVYLYYVKLYVSETDGDSETLQWFIYRLILQRNALWIPWILIQSRDVPSVLCGRSVTPLSANPVLAIFSLRISTRALITRLCMTRFRLLATFCHARLPWMRKVSQRAMASYTLRQRRLREIRWTKSTACCSMARKCM